MEKRITMKVYFTDMSQSEKISVPHRMSAAVNWTLHDLLRQIGAMHESFSAYHGHYGDARKNVVIDKIVISDSLRDYM